MNKNKTLKKDSKTQKNKCTKQFCKLYTRKYLGLYKGLLPKNIMKKMKKETMKNCKLFFCNEGCKGTILEPGKKFPKLSKDNQQVKVYGKEYVEELRKSLFKNKTNILVDNAHELIPKKIVNRYKKKGALSLCDHYIPGGSVEFLSKKL
jgi:hypothetical protein